MAGTSRPLLPPNMRALGSDGAVRVYEYRCQAAKGERPQVEEFSAPSLSIVCSGVFGFRNERQPRLLTTDFVLLGNPGQAYEISHEQAGGDRCLIFQLDEATLAELAGPGRPARRYFPHAVLPPLPRVAGLRHLTEERLAGGAAALGLEELAVAAASYVMTETGAGPARADRPPERGRRTRDRLYRAIEWLERSAAEDVHLADIARIAELTPFHFLRVFKQEIGVTPYRFLVRARLRAAVERLTRTRDPITSIAYDVGFGDLSNFVHTFRRELGCTPSRFRARAMRR